MQDIQLTNTGVTLLESKQMRRKYLGEERQTRPYPSIITLYSNKNKP